MKIATWNVNSIKVRIDHVLAWLVETNMDVLCLQELKLDTHLFPSEKFADIGYNYCAINGQKTYNGVAIISRYPLEDIAYDIPEYADEQKRVISVTVNNIRVINCYFVNGEALDSQKYQYKLEWLANLNRYVATEISQHPKLVLLGDYNIAPENRDTYDAAAWDGQILCSVAEREEFNNLIKLGLTDALRYFKPQEERLFTWWDYRNFAFRRKQGLRIDHILVSNELIDLATSCEVDPAPRKLERPSDHAPVILEF